MLHTTILEESFAYQPSGVIEHKPGRYSFRWAQYLDK